MDYTTKREVIRVARKPPKRIVIKKQVKIRLVPKTPVKATQTPQTHFDQVIARFKQRYKYLTFA
jgi:hypothetical protein